LADDNGGILAEFEEFLKAKQEAAQQTAGEDDYDVEIWDETGKGARVKRSHAKPFLQSLGIDLDPESEGDKDDKGKTKPPPKGRTATTTQPTGSITRKYFVKPTGK
jgi:hypothetical protein